MVARSPAPIRPKPSTVPANDRFRPDNRNRAQDAGKPAIEPNEQNTIGIVQIWSLRHPAAKHVDLLPQDQIFHLQFYSRPKERSQEAKNQLEQISHQAASLARPFPASTLNRIFGTHKALESALLMLFWRFVLTRPAISTYGKTHYDLEVRALRCPSPHIILTLLACAKYSA
jgi:hypothetical protein